MKTDAEVKRLMTELEKKSGNVTRAAAAAGMDRKTAKKYGDGGRLPSTMKTPRLWRTRVDPFEEVWPEVVEMLKYAPELQAPTVFEYLNDRAIEKEQEPFQDNQLRTLYRRFKQWRASEGPPKEVSLRQLHVPGEAMQTDFTDASQLRVTIAGEPFPHLLGHSVLPYSNWQAARVVRSESLLAIRRTVQHAVFKLRHVPRRHQTDNSSAATHKLGKDGRTNEQDEPTPRSSSRGFNELYLQLMDHFSMEPVTTIVGAKEQNGDIESANKALKNRIEQYLLLRQSRDFESVEAYEAWLDALIDKANRRRTKRLAEELAVMRPLVASKLAEFEEEEDVSVNKGSVVRIRRNTYSVPSRLIGEKIQARIFDDRIEIYYAQTLQLTVPRLLGSHNARIDYRHVIHSLLQKPNGFERYVYKEQMYPTVTFRRAYDVLVEKGGNYLRVMEYLRILRLAAMTMETEVEAALQLLLEAGERPTCERVEALMGHAQKCEIPELVLPEVDLSEYDNLLSEVTS